MRVFNFLIIFLFFSNAYAVATDIYPFNSVQQQTRFEELLHQLRCVVCQNENLADSNAPLAKDLRYQIYNMVKQDKSNKEITQYLVARYGEFVEFLPRFDAISLLLWLGPFIALAMLLFKLYRTIIKRKEYINRKNLSAKDQERIKQILNEYQELS